METKQYPIRIFFIFLLPFLLVGCKSSKKTQEQPLAQESQMVSVQEQPLTDIQDSSFDLEYDTIYQKAIEIEKNYETIKPRAEKFIDSYYPKNQIQKHRMMTVALIAAGCNYWIDNMSNAKFYGTKAYEFKEDKSIEFPKEWEPLAWRQGRDTNTLKKLVSMKDFLRSCANAGFEAFCKANEAFFGKGQVLDALQDYQKTMQWGLEKESLRKECYLRLSACLYKAGRKDEAEKLFLELLILDPDPNLNVGDQATRDYLNELKQKYSQ